MNVWFLPDRVELGGKQYPHATDYRDMLKIIRILNDEPVHLRMRWICALIAFFPEGLPPARYFDDACHYISDFLTTGLGENGMCSCPLLDWDGDAQEILEGVNGVAGYDVRTREYLHWWSFILLFQNIREGRLVDLVAIRYKLRTGQKLTAAEQEFLRRNPRRFRPKETGEELAQKQALEKLLSQ